MSVRGKPMLARGSISGGSTSVDSSRQQKEDLARIQQDIMIISQKITELGGEAAPEPEALSASPFVVSLRSLAEPDKRCKDATEQKLASLEKLLAKMGEYDRLLLKETAPAVDPSAPPVRRKSLGTDMFTMPTHLHLSARLLDLHTASKRVTVIKMTEGTRAPPPLTVQEAKVLEGLRNTVAKQTAQLTESETRRTQAEEENAYLRRQVQILQDVQKEKEKEQRAPESEPSPEPKQARQQDQDELAALRALIAQQEGTIADLQERLEIEVGVIQNIVSVTMGKASRISSHADLNSKGDDCLSLPDNVRTGFAILEHAVTDRLDGLRSELGLVISLKDLLEGELSTCMLHRDMIQKDLSSLTEQSDALKAAYDALSYETARQQSLQAEGAVEGSRERELLQRAEESNQRIEGDLQRAQKRVQELESTPFVVAALEEQVAILLAEKTRDLSKVKSAKEEVGHWKKLAESLKQKLRDLGEQEGDNGKNFMDSFEEVMQEEMMAMKGAFESKLRCAKEDADANSKKHLQEIQRIQNTSPYASMVRLSPNL